MRAVQIALCVLAGAVIPAGSAQADQRPEVVGPPVIVPTSSPVSVRPGRQPLPVEDSVLHLPDPETTCEDGAVTPLYSEILPAQVQGWGPLDGDTVLTFSIAADGRTTDIRPAGSAPAAFDTLQAGLAAWRFPAQARKDCRLTVRWRNTPLAEAETPDLLNYFAVNRDRGAVRDAVVKRLGGPVADCGERFGGRRPAVMAYPDFKQGRRPPPGGRSWTVVRWNIDAEGRTTDIETLGSSGDTDLDAEARRATAESRMQPGPARTGCVYNFYRIGETLPAPPMPPESQREDPLQQCPPEVDSRFHARGAAETYPRAFRDRVIEGWALVRFDFATWGQVGNLSVIEAQPASAFAESAGRTVLSGRADPGFTAGVRCVVPVRYRIGDTPAPAEEAEGAPD